jgi:NADH dehydrogenase [ubiquinone] 1 alpha subcomplex assembly factor 7
MSGPERLDAFMARANATYYATHDPFADFTTAPEISQVVGELLGAWAAVTWQAMGAPVPVILAEAGPGRGTLMADALRLVRRTAPGFAASLRLHLVETSPRLRARAESLLPDGTWHARIDDLPAGPLLLLANEFLDALPIRQFVRRGGGWTERFVAGGTFLEFPASPTLPQTADGEVREVCAPALALAAQLGARLARDGGAALFLDYGPAASGPGDSLQAVREGRPASPLADPGSADLTAHVDFAAFAAAARGAGAATWGPVPQGMFLARLGLHRRTDALARANPAQAPALVAAAQRLAEPHGMGRLFKALALTHPDLPAPAGFTE